MIDLLLAPRSLWRETLFCCEAWWVRNESLMRLEMDEGLRKLATSSPGPFRRAPAPIFEQQPRSKAHFHDLQ
jgi:hypothetical protein